MDFSFTDEQQMLRDGVGKFLEKSYDFDARQKVIASDRPWSAEAWQQFAEFGLLALPFAEEQGGLGGSITDCVAFAELFGQHLVVEPYVAAVVLGGGALAASSGEAAQTWLAKVMAGDAAATFAYEEGPGTASPEQIAMEASLSGDAVTLSGEKRLVIAGAEADVLIVAARDTADKLVKLYLLEQGATGLAARAYSTIDGRSAANVTFDNVPAIALECPAQTLETLIARAITVQAAEAVGAMGALMRLTGDYAATRKQFGVPIASFQAVAHRLADMKIAYTKARATMIYTAALLETGAASPRDIATLKGQVGKLGQSLGEAAIQTHGGVGMTDELSISHYHKRLLALDAQFGSHAYHLRSLGRR